MSDARSPRGGAVPDGRPAPPVSADAERLTATVRGRVQGVGFRRYVRKWARKLDLVGWVRNEPDGTVRLVAEGGADGLDRLVRLIWGGPPPAVVEDVDAERGGAEGGFDAFTVERR
ncbi:acylphosphatase [Rubrivirga litoralis]|uniref:Acylphosphatase n=1 Tax=Rubrivirga litoralis TaxID=3075598 RepID=A0ABU3BUS4_9BACT|nr:acylphosphatase [Rubrivirga sp. F394]MDT0633048.1 acylphosphatase [Rubrivirga sp. F394]